MNKRQGLLILIVFVVIAMYGEEGFSEPLGGWDTFPGPVAECTGSDCK